MENQANPEAEHGPFPIPQPAELTPVEKESAMSSYLMMYASYVVMGLPIPWINAIATGIYWVVNRRKSRYIAFHSWQNFLSNIFTSVINTGWMAWVIVALVTEKWTPVFFVGTGVVLLFNLGYMISGIVGAVKAHKGLMYYQVLFGRMAFEKYYGAAAGPLQPPAAVNRPPSGY